MRDLVYNQLKICPLFKNMSDEDIRRFISKSNYRLNNFNEHAIIASEGDTITDLGIILSGAIEVQKVYITGKIVKVKDLCQGDLVGLVNVFSDSNRYPCTIVAKSHCKVFFISQESVIDLCLSNKSFLTAFIKKISNQTVFLTKKLKLVSYDTIRKKIAHFLLELYEEQNQLIINIVSTRKEMADTFGVSRPALSNEMIHMKKEGFIAYGKGYIQILDLKRLSDQIT